MPRGALRSHHWGAGTFISQQAHRSIPPAAAAGAIRLMQHFHSHSELLPSSSSLFMICRPFFSPSVAYSCLNATRFSVGSQSPFCACSATLPGFSALLHSSNNLCLPFLQRHLTVLGFHSFPTWICPPAERGHCQSETGTTAKPSEYTNRLSEPLLLAAQKQGHLPPDHLDPGLTQVHNLLQYLFTLAEKSFF